MTRIGWIGLWIAPLALVGCESNPLVVDSAPEALSVDLTLSSAHVHTLTPVTLTVRVTDDHGTAVVDFEQLAVERREVGGETWRAIELERSGDSFVGDYTFMSSGDYELQVAGMRHGETEPAVLHQMHEPLGVGRAHVNQGGYRIEFESFPGHVHEGDEAVAKFWVKLAEANDAGERAPIPNLTPLITFVEVGSSRHEQHQAVEHEPGVYEASHMWMSHGEARSEISFTGANGEAVSVSFQYAISSVH